jgi:TRAP-type mannitol/chloroaromatic compound transport system permease small subunit
MPHLGFILPLWAYWLGLIAFPLCAMYMFRRQLAQPPAMVTSLPIAYLLWLTGGFVGLHRFYVRSYWGALYIPVFIGILYANFRERLALDAVSRARSDLSGATFDVDKAQAALDNGTAGAADALSKAQDAAAAAEAGMQAATQYLQNWHTFAGGLAGIIAVGLLIDAFLLPRLVRARRAREVVEPIPPDLIPVAEPPSARGVRYPLFVRFIDALNLQVGHFIAFWSIIAVFVYYYEVIARYVFNSPTNWAHQSMFLMFGMQYLLAGGYALRVDAHVRVDVIYGMLPRRAQAFFDVVTSIAFFIFAGVLCWTGAVFGWRAIRVWEVSFTEWPIQYWPVKCTIAIGAFLLVIQGISKLTKDIYVLAGRGT